MMDLLEPYDYQELGEFAPEFLSGFQQSYGQSSEEVQKISGRKNQ